MATFTKLPSGQWRAQIRRQGHSISRTFRLKTHADAWVRDQDARIDRGETPVGKQPASRETFADLIELHFADMAEVNRAFGRSKESTLLRLKDSLGATRVGNISRDLLVQFAKRRAKDGAGPVTIGIDISFIGTVLEHAAAVHGIAVPTEQVRLARVALNRLGLIAKSNERDRRPTQDELDQIIAAAEDNPRQIIPIGRIVRDLGIKDLHFHDLRHEGISRLFEADWDIPQVAAVSGHRDWKMLQRYTHLRPSFIATRAGAAQRLTAKNRHQIR